MAGATECALPLGKSLTDAEGSSGPTWHHPLKLSLLSPQCISLAQSSDRFLSADIYPVGIQTLFNRQDTVTRLDAGASFVVGVSQKPQRKM